MTHNEDPAAIARGVRKARDWIADAAGELEDMFRVPPAGLRGLVEPVAR